MKIWICDKGRFAYHYTESDLRLTEPMVRKGGELLAVSWDEALKAAAAGLKKAGDQMLTLAGGRLSNEDLFNLKQLTTSLGGQPILNSQMGGGELLSQVGISQGPTLANWAGRGHPGCGLRPARGSAYLVVKGQASC